MAVSFIFFSPPILFVESGKEMLLTDEHAGVTAILFCSEITLSLFTAETAYVYSLPVSRFVSEYEVYVVSSYFSPFL